MLIVRLAVSDLCYLPRLVTIIVLVIIRSESVEESRYVRKWCDEGSSNLSLMLGSSGSRSCGSALSSDGSFGMSEDRGFKFSYTGDLFHLMNFKVRNSSSSRLCFTLFVWLFSRSEFVLKKFEILRNFD